MTERTQFPNSPACGAWETLLADALDGLLSAEDQAKFAVHKVDCPACAALYEEARKGREWLEFLSPEPEPPEGLLAKILAQTGPGHAASVPMPAVAGLGVVPAFVAPARHPGDYDLSLGAPVWQQPGFFARMKYAAQPRLMMTAAMAFFSIALTLNMTGVQLSSLRLADLRPRTMRAYMERQLNMASVPIVRYYDHLRLVYEVESRVRELRSQGEANGQPGQNQQQDQSQPANPGETKKNPGKGPGHGDGVFGTDPDQAPENPAMEPAVNGNNDFQEASFRLQGKRMQSVSSEKRARERSRVWIA